MSNQVDRPVEMKASAPVAVTAPKQKGPVMNPYSTGTGMGADLDGTLRSDLSDAPIVNRP